MSKKSKTKKVKTASKALPSEVVLLEDACDMVMANASVVTDLLRQIAFCGECGGVREE